MATINLGAIKFNWKGAYNNSTAYAVDDVVSSSGNSYICIQASQGNAVGNATAYWNIMSEKGTAGTNGTNGTNGTDGTDLSTTLTTQGDILYRDGSGLQRLAKGTAGQGLVMNSGANAPEWADAGGGGASDILLNVSSGFSAGTNVDLNGYKSFHAHVRWGDTTNDSRPYVVLATTNVGTGGTGASVGSGWGYYTRIGQTDNQLTTITDYTPDTNYLYTGMNGGVLNGFMDIKVDGLGTSNLSINTHTKSSFTGLSNNHFFGSYNGSNCSSVRYLRFQDSSGYHSTHYIKYIKVIGYK